MNGSQRIAQAKRYADAQGWGSFYYTDATGRDIIYIKYGGKWRRAGVGGFRKKTV